MKALATQFDTNRLSSAVATPTCSSCCCCCCCLATSIASSTLLAQRVAKEGKKHQISNRNLLTFLAALFVPIVGLLVYFGYWLISALFKTCTEQSYSSYIPGQGSFYTVCTNPGAGWIVPLLVIAPFLVLLYLYARVRIEHPVKRATLVTILIAVAFIAEFFGGATLILTGVGGIFYLILIPIIVGWITTWYRNHLKEEDASEPILPIQTTEGQEGYVKKPPQSNPPTSSTK